MARSLLKEVPRVHREVAVVSATSEVFPSASFQNAPARSARSEQGSRITALPRWSTAIPPARPATGSRTRARLPHRAGPMIRHPPPTQGRATPITPPTTPRRAPPTTAPPLVSAATILTTASPRRARPNRNRPRNPTMRNRRKIDSERRCCRERSSQNRSGQPGCGNGECGCSRDCSGSDRNRCRCLNGAGLRQGHRAACDRRRGHRRRIVRHRQRFDRHADGIRHRCRRRRNARRCQGRRCQDRAAGRPPDATATQVHAGRRDSAERHRAGGFRHRASRAENRGNAQRPSRCEGCHHVTR